jgi:hypothetical protein
MEGQESGQKRHQDRRFSSEKKEELVKPWKTPITMGRAIHRQGNKHARGFSLISQTGEELPYSWNVDSQKRYYP